MNERIKELAEQAGLTRILDEHAHEYGNGMFENTPYPELSKFAELIVRECMNIAKNWQDQLENANCLKESNAVGIVAYRIARQFGVKE